MSEPIVKILPLSALLRAILDGTDAMGCLPARVVASRRQIEAWCAPVPVAPEFVDQPKTLTVQGIPVIEGPDAPPELIWAIPVTDGQNAGKAP
jgi:hypothetical protein